MASKSAVIPLDLLLPDPLDQPGEIVLRVARDPDLGVEVDDRDVDGVGRAC